MADSKITALTAISTVDPAADPLVIVDVSDTSMAASGTTKKSTINQLLGAGGTATLASATITGAATVGTTLGVTGVSTFAAGTALLPALTTTGDTNTGIYYPAADTFAVTTGGSERYRVDSSGNLLVGTTTANGRVAVDADLTTYNGMSVKNTVATYGSSALFVKFINSSGATAGSIQHTAVTTTNYSTTSDARLKESKGISTDTSVIDNTVVHDFVWKADGSTDRGVFAQEAHSVKPRAVSVGSDELTDDGNIKTPWSVDYSKFVPDLIVYCQQLKKQVVELTARVQTLETR